MRVLSVIIGLTLCFWLVSCDQNSNISDEKQGVENSHANMQTKHLSMLLEHAVSMMAQGAELKLHAQKHGDVMLAQSADLLRRAMSGPEMAAMHKGGQGHSSMMQHTHDLGAAAFDVLDLMMSLQVQNKAGNIDILHHALNMAAEGASLKSLSVMDMMGDIDQSMLGHGEEMQQAAMALASGIKVQDTAYQKAVLKVMYLLIDASPAKMSHTH